MQSSRTHSSGPTLSEQPSRRNILIFGDVGAGKSSLVNLITGEDLAKTSGRALLCTLEPQEYTLTLDGVVFALYDTPGMHEAQGKMETSKYLEPIHKCHALISKLERSGGINLLVFVLRAGRVSIPQKETYLLFTEVLCTRQVPVVIVVTHLEEYEDMEEWWQDNDDVFKEYGLRSIGHACVTATRGFRDACIDKYEQSKLIIRKLLLECSGHVWEGEKASWFQRLAPQMRLLLSPRRQHRDLKWKLIDQCGFLPHDADIVAQRIEQSQKTLELPRGDEEVPKETQKISEERPQEGEESQKDTQETSEEQPQDDKESQSDTEEQSWSWFDERFGYDSSYCVSLPLLY